ncbi:MAG TPA: sigma-70 family RNA polymerase sigma factor [Mycobacteriales bacterium]|nr:sigma-70 family RNA polymerase sigma factor [Mycobacteriales bacterium]
MEDLDAWLATSYGPAYRTACLILRNPADAEEAVQDAFLRAWRFRDALPADPAGMRPWLYRVVVNSCCSKLRAETPHRTRRGSLDGVDVADPDATPELLSMHSESTRLVLSALADLPEHLRITVVLRYYAGLSEKEIATAISRRAGTVKSRLHEARQRLAADPRLRGLHQDSEEAR